MVIGVGFTTFLLPYQVPPAMVGLQVGALRVRQMLRLALPLAAFGLLVMLPLAVLVVAGDRLLRLRASQRPRY